jgi:Domain of unknown function (DUF6484)
MDRTAGTVLLTQVGARLGTVCAGWIVRLTRDGQAIVDFSGNELGPVVAQSIIDHRDIFGRAQSLEHTRVLLAFEGGNPALPIVIGFLHRELFPEPADSSGRGQQNTVIHGRKVVITADEEITISCGESSLELKKDGKLVAKGTNVVSRASRSNKIKGAVVAIN